MLESGFRENAWPIHLFIIRSSRDYFFPLPLAPPGLETEDCIVWRLESVWWSERARARERETPDNRSRRTRHGTRLMLIMPTAR